jgi:hypothetical protein
MLAVIAEICRKSCVFVCVCVRERERERDLITALKPLDDFSVLFPMCETFTNICRTVPIFSHNEVHLT